MDFSGDIGLWQRKIAECPEGAKRRMLTFEALEIAPGGSVVEVGCGGGHLVREVALAVGSAGRAVGVDLSSDQLAAAREHCAGVARAEFIEGDAGDLPFEDATFDGYAAVNTLEYVPDPDAALAEARRVLRPGGRIATISVLWDHWQYHGAEPALTRRMLDSWRAHCAHQMLPMELPARLARAGFGGTRREPFTFLNGTLHENAYAYWGAKVVAAFATAQGVPEADAQRWLDELAAADREGRFGFVNVSVLTTAVAH